MSHTARPIVLLLASLALITAGCDEPRPRVGDTGEVGNQTSAALTKASAEAVDSTTAVDSIDAVDAPPLPSRDHSEWRPQMPMVLVGSCPGEGCRSSFPAVMCTTVSLRATDAADAMEVLTLEKGDTATLVIGNFHLAKPGLVLIVRDSLITDLYRDVEIDGVPSYVNDTLHVFAGDTLYLIDYVEVGRKWWYRGKPGEGYEFWSGPMKGSSGDGKHLPAVSLSGPRGEWWYKLRAQSGAEGWVYGGASGWHIERKFVEVDSEFWECPP